MSISRLFFDGDWQEGERTAVVENKFTGEPLGEVFLATAEQTTRAIGSLEASHRARALHPYERFELLSRASRIVEERRAQLRDGIVAETGFTVADADGEISRAVQTLRLSGEEATRLNGEVVPLDGAPGVANRLAFTVRRPVGVVCAITPFNSPLNTVAHKVGPAIAAGNAVVLKPASYTPFTAAALVEILLEAGLPPTHIALLHGSATEVGAALLSDRRIGFYTFTGSTAVGEHIQRTVGLRRMQLELGSLSSTIVCQDADIELAAQRCMAGSFRKAGQVCTSIQRLYVQRPILAEFTDAFVELTSKARAGDPADPETFVGPLISQSELRRVASWVQAAREGGASLLAGGQHHGRVLQPTVLTDVQPQMDVLCQEVFGPVVSIQAYDEFEDALSEVDATPYGLAAGIFTADIRRALGACERLRMGSVHINETSSSRVDLMPYGGVKDSGFGHEGPRYAAREMTEEQLVTINYGSGVDGMTQP